MARYRHTGPADFPSHDLLRTHNVKRNLRISAYFQSGNPYLRLSSVAQCVIATVMSLFFFPFLFCGTLTRSLAICNCSSYTTCRTFVAQISGARRDALIAAERHHVSKIMFFRALHANLRQEIGPWIRILARGWKIGARPVSSSFRISDILHAKSITISEPYVFLESVSPSHFFVSSYQGCRETSG